MGPGVLAGAGARIVRRARPRHRPVSEGLDAVPDPQPEPSSPAGAHRPVSPSTVTVAEERFRRRGPQRSCSQRVAEGGRAETVARLWSVLEGTEGDGFRGLVASRAAVPPQIARSKTGGRGAAALCGPLRAVLRVLCV